MVREENSILVVEDDDVDSQMIKRAFARKGMADRLRYARDGQAAMEWLRDPSRTALPQVVVLDQNMPRMTGLEFLEALRTDLRLKDIPVIMMTTSRNPDERHKAESLGVQAYFVKEDLMPDYPGLFELLN